MGQIRNFAVQLGCLYGTKTENQWTDKEIPKDK